MEFIVTNMKDTTRETADTQEETEEAQPTTEEETAKPTEIGTQTVTFDGDMPTANITPTNGSSTKEEFEDERIDRLLALEDNTEQIEARKEAIVREIVSKLPEPCDKILWGFYRDGFSMKTLASMYNYKTEGSVKVTKHRCGEKFKARFLEISKCFFD